MSSFLIQGGTLVTMNRSRDVVKADLRIRNGRIVEIGAGLRGSPNETVVKAEDTWVIPGLVQAHTHLCQTLFRGMADDLELLDWLHEKIWPFENAHTEDSLRVSAQVGLLEMQLAGTTSILDMGTVRHHDVVFEEAERSGMRYWGGNCLMDRKATSGPLYLSTEESLKECERLIAKWNGKHGRIHYALSPRFVISCSEKILKAASKLCEEHNLLFHTHASENKTEIKLVKKQTGMGNVEYLNKIGVLHERTVVAHGIHLSQKELSQMVKSETGLTHCPSSNLKLASGIAHIHEYREKGLKVALGADGAPCNNLMDPFMEMRLAALLQKPISGPTALNAREAFQMATIDGARVLNAEDKIGSLEVGKHADVVIVDRSHPSHIHVEDPYSDLVYSTTGRDVRDVWIDGQWIVRDKSHQIFELSKVRTFATDQLRLLKNRIKK